MKTQEMTKKTAREITQEFFATAKAEGYTEKVVGDIAFRKRAKNGKYQYIRFWGTNKVVRFEQ